MARKKKASAKKSPPKKAKETKSMLFILLDESGSMMDKRNDVVGGVNAYIDDQRKLPDPAVIAIAAFGTHIPGNIRFIRPMVDLKTIEKLTDDDYRPNGGTPLHDATGKSILDLDEDWKREKPDRCIFSTFTDGWENASKEFDKAKVRALIEAREKSGYWNFIYMGANVDSFAEASAMGYKMSKTANFVASGKGFRAASQKMSETTYSLREMALADYREAAAGSLNVGLGGNIAEDGSASTKAGGASVTVTTGGSALPPGTPPAAAMAQPAWTPPQSSALFDPKTQAWKVPT